MSAKSGVELMRQAVAESIAEHLPDMKRGYAIWLYKQTYGRRDKRRKLGWLDKDGNDRRKVFQDRFGEKWAEYCKALKEREPEAFE